MLKLKDIKKTYIVDNKHFPALKNINLSFPDKGFISILGPSGCGKTTLLNLIGGLDQYTSGDLIINNKSTKKFTDADWDAYRNKRVGFVFQSYNLVPHLTVLGNVELSMTLTGMSKKERQKKAEAALKRVGLGDTLKKKPNQLSGGQMQRVAIARSLINNPEIVLADEPTGALDSVTSVQVMEILKEVAKDRLVIMVTHNDELAKKYSTRIIRLKDGLVISDSKPLKITSKVEQEALEKEKNKHTHMSFFTALGSSAKSLMTKKGRTIMTSVAASFGIIGVALVLAMSNGFTGYVGRVEAATASSVPITISPFVTTSVKETNLPEAWPSEQVIKPYEQDLSQLVVVHHNQLTTSYADYCREMLKTPNHYASSVLENHEYLDFNIFTERETVGGTKEIIKVNQFKAAGAEGSILSGTTGLPSTIFHELYGNKDYINSNYEVIYGNYPNEQMYKDENGQWHCDVCLVCDRYNRLPIKTLYALGLSSTESAQEGDIIKFDKIVPHEYKAFSPDLVYDKNSVVTETIKPGEGLILGDSIFDLKENTEDIVIKQYKNIEKDSVRLNELYKDANRKGIILNITGIIRLKKNSLINLMPGSVCYPTDLKNYYIKLIENNPEYKEFSDTSRNNWYIPNTPLMKDYWKNEVMLGYFTALGTANNSSFINFIDTDASPICFYDIVTDKNEIDLLHDTIKYSTYIHNNYRFANSFKEPKIIYKDIPGIGRFPVDMERDSIDSALDAINYIGGYSTITSILVFPKDLSSKPKIFNYLDKWNEGKPDEAKIMYADLAGSLTEALGTMIDIISIVLIVFSSVSLLVSCVMTGVITYTSVLERTKEIGILRAIGARKKDVGRLFEAESVIIGGIAGLAGVLFTFIVEWPISLIINNNFPEQNIGMICNLSPWHAVILVLISILLTFVSGFIPARKAANKDPVVALRTE